VKLTEKEKYLCVTSNHALLYLGLKIMQQLQPPSSPDSPQIDFRFASDNLKIARSLIALGFFISRYQPIWFTFVELATKRGDSTNAKNLPEEAWNNLASFSIEHNVKLIHCHCNAQL